MDIQQTKLISDAIDKECKLSKEYKDSRMLSAKAKFKLDIILASSLAEIRKIKPNAGYETSLLMLIEMKGDEVKGYYEQMLKETARYKGLERIIDSLQDRIRFGQSLMRYEREGERDGI